MSPLSDWMTTYGRAWTRMVPPRLQQGIFRKMGCREGWICRPCLISREWGASVWGGCNGRKG